MTFCSLPRWIENCGTSKPASSAAQLVPDFLPEAVEIEQLVGADRHRVEPLEQAEFLQLLDRVRQRVDADAKLADAIALLVDLAVDATRMQHQRGDEPAHAPADNDDLHARDTLYATPPAIVARHTPSDQSPGSHTVSGLYGPGCEG